MRCEYSRLKREASNLFGSGRAFGLVCAIRLSKDTNRCGSRVFLHACE